jgi:hypothetical protein
LRGRLFYLFVSLLVLVVLAPFLRGLPIGEIILYAVSAIVGLSTLYGLKLRKRALVTTAVLAIIYLALGAVSLAKPSTALNAASALGSLGFFGAVIALLLRYIVRARRVTADILFGSVSVYLLIGLLYGMLYIFIDILNPAAFTASNAAAGGPTGADLSYYSFVTLTTLGYGDITPVSGYARTFAFLEAITGTLYVAILVSRLVSLYITHSMQSKEKRS